MLLQKLQNLFGVQKADALDVNQVLDMDNVLFLRFPPFSRVLRLAFVLVQEIYLGPARA